MPMTRGSTAAISCDLLIVGASFAGLVAARTAALRGLNVVVLEAKRDVGARVATTGILVKEAAEELDLPHWLTRRVHGVRLYSPSLRHIDLHAPGYYFLTTDTPNVLRWLAEEAERAGARILRGRRFAAAERTEQGFRIAGPEDIATRFILGADGARSAVARAFKLGTNTRFLVGLEAEYKVLDAGASGLLHCFLDSRLAPGYLAWVAPGPVVTQVGLAVTDGHRADLDAFRRHTDHLFGFSNGHIVERRAGRIPCGGIVQPWAKPGVMLIGDAAGMVSPATAGGIHQAFRFGRRAGQTIADHLIHGAPEPHKVLAPELPQFGKKMLMRALLDCAPPNVLIDLAIATAPMRWLAARIYFHRRATASGVVLEPHPQAPHRLDPTKEPVHAMGHVPKIRRLDH